LSYGLPTGTNITYGSPGFPAWVYELAGRFNLKASTYPGHQEGQRAEKGFAPNPNRLNRGIDWVGTAADMQRFADYLLTIRTHLEQVIWENPNDGQRAGVAGGDDVTHTPYYAGDYAGHRDHVHTRQSKPIPLPGGATVGWTGDPVWLADVLRGYQGGPSLKVRELDAWQQYGHGDYKNIWGVMVHHTGNARETAESIRRGRPDLAGPLSNLHIAQDGTVTVVAAGVCWHAGAGSYPGLPTNNANWHVIGIECAWPRDTSLTPATQGRERWPDPQIIAMRDTVAAILTKLGFGSDRVIGHKEWAGRAQGKWDPGNIDMGWFRGEVAKSMRGDFKVVKPLDPKPDQAAVIKQTQWERIWRTHIEWLAFTYGDPKAVAELVAAARTGDVSAMRAVAKLEQVNPAALQNYIATKG
jgi:hypothetical protein